MPDRGKVIKAWECCNPFNRKCKECPYEKDCYHDGISRHMVADAVALLQEQETQKFFVDESGKITPLPVIVRCKDCKHGYKCEFSIRCENKNKPSMFGQHFSENWFCADGERKEGR